MQLRIRFLYFTLLFLFPALSNAQKQLVEGFIVYKVRINDAANNTIAKGTYTLTYKGKLLREELILNNGFHDILLSDYNTQTIYSLKENGGKKYAIQISMEGYVKKNENFENFTLTNTNKENKDIVGMTAMNATITYNSGETCDIYYTAEWQPMDKWMFDHFPGIRYLPLSFAYTQNNNAQIFFEAKQMENSPVENALFKVPTDYKMISYDEYRQMYK